MQVNFYRNFKVSGRSFLPKYAPTYLHFRSLKEKRTHLDFGPLYIQACGLGLVFVLLET